MSALDIQTAEPATLALAVLTRDPELICRAAGIKKATVADYSAAMKAGATFPAVVVFGPDSRGAHWLADGFHRCAAAEVAGLADIAVDLRPGGRKEALLHAASANGSHGLRRTNADKRKAVALLIATYPRWSDRKIAEACNVDHKTVGTLRAKPAGEFPTTPSEPAPSGEIPTPAPAPATDAAVAKLSKALQRILEEWPPSRRAELQERLLEAATAPQAPPG